MKRIIMFILFALGGAASTYADDAVKLVYPIEAANSALDASTPAKRITPPVVEDSEYDPVTPIGQIRSILDTLGSIEEKQTAITNDVSELRKQDRNVDLSCVFTKSDGAEIKETLNNATVKLASIAAAPVRSKLIDWTTIVTFALVVLQTVVLCGQTIASFVRSRRDALEEEIAKRYLEKQQNSPNKSSGGII